MMIVQQAFEFFWSDCRANHKIVVYDLGTIPKIL
jgi:hypothetical protein